MKEVFFSILVPVHNTENYLRECIESVLRQTFPDYELILLLDGSSDSCDALCDEYATRYSSIQVLHKRNEGLMMTRRRGFSAAAGEFFICLDSDDYLYDNEALEKIHRIIVETGCDLILFDYIHGAANPSSERRVRLFEYSTGHVFSQKEEIYTELISTNRMNNIWLKCPKHDIVDIDVDYSQWKEFICRAEDVFQSLPMVTNAQKVAYISEPLYYYRWTKSSISNNYKIRYYNAYCTIYQREAEYIPRWSLPREYGDYAERNFLIATCKLIALCYINCKEKGMLGEWVQFIHSLSVDKTFLDAGSVCDMRKLSLFYRLIYFSVKYKCFLATKFVVAVVPKLDTKFKRRIAVRWKKKKKQ